MIDADLLERYRFFHETRRNIAIHALRLARAERALDDAGDEYEKREQPEPDPDWSWLDDDAWTTAADKRHVARERKRIADDQLWQEWFDLIQLKVDADGRMTRESVASLGGISFDHSQHSREYRREVWAELALEARVGEPKPPPRYTCVVPWVPDAFRTEWHPTEATGSFKRLQRGDFASVDEAITWGKSHLGGTPYEVREV